MKHILMACGTGVCTSSAVRDRRRADVPALSPTHDFLVAVTLRPGTLDIPFVNGVPFLTGADATESESALLQLMGERELKSA